MDDLIRGSLVVVLQVLPIGGWPRSRRDLQSTLKVLPVPRLWGPGRRTYRVSRSASIRTTGRRAIAHSSSLPIEPLLLVASSAANWLKINCIQSFCCPRSPKARDRGHPRGEVLCLPPLLQKKGARIEHPARRARWAVLVNPKFRWDRFTT